MSTHSNSILVATHCTPYPPAHGVYLRILKMIEMARTAFGRAQVCEECLKKIDVEEVVYFLKRDLVELRYQAAKKLPRLRFLLGQLIRRPHPTVDHLTERLQRKTWGQSRCTNRYRRLSGLLKKYQVRSPVFY